MLADSYTQGDDITATTKATGQLDSDEDNVTEQCPSPMPFKGSNAVSPDGEGLKHSFRKQTSCQDGVDLLKVSLLYQTGRDEFPACCSDKV